MGYKLQINTLYLVFNQIQCEVEEGEGLEHKRIEEEVPCSLLKITSLPASYLE